MEHIFKNGAFESTPDKRDIKHTEIKGALLLTIGECDYSNQPVLNQGRKGVCTAIALAQMISKMYGYQVSWTFIYKVGKRVYDQNTIEGSSLRTMLKVAYNYGAPRYELAPYDINQSYEEFMAMADFSPEVYTDALKQTIGGYNSVPIDKFSLAEAINKTPYGLYTRIESGKNFWTDKDGNITWDKNKLSPLRPFEWTTQAGGHAILKRAYDYTNGIMTRDRNTWGSEWCDGGEIDIPDFNDNITEAWTIFKDPIIHSFNTNLMIGMSGDEVKNLQLTLKIQGTFNYNITGYFGPITLLAVKKFQTLHSISSTGFVGHLTRSALNKLI